MIRKTFLAKLSLFISLVVELFFIITVFKKRATGLSVGLAVASTIALPITVTFLVKLSSMEPTKKARTVKALWFICAVVIGLLLCVAFLASQFELKG